MLLATCSLCYLWDSPACGFILPSLSVLHIPFVHSFLSVSPKDINFSLFYFVCFFLDIFFTYISNVIPFSGFCSPTHPLPLPSSGVPLHSGIKLSQDQGPVLPLMTNKAILCCICSWSHGFLHVYSLVGSLIPGRVFLCVGGSGCFILLLLLWGCKLLQLFGFFL